MSVCSDCPGGLMCCQTEELPRAHDLAPRRWQLPSGEIIGEAVNREAIDLLKSDPDEYFRRTRRRVITHTEK